MILALWMLIRGKAGGASGVIFGEVSERLCQSDMFSTIQSRLTSAAHIVMLGIRVERSVDNRQMGPVHCCLRLSLQSPIAPAT